MDHRESDDHSADITWDVDGQPLSRRFGDVYFSKSSGIDESRFVFLKHNQLPARWQHLADDNLFTIAETGFGSGLNFLTAWQAWLARSPAQATLHFISVEKYPMERDDLQRALHLWPELAPLAQQLVAQYPAVDARGFHRLRFGQVQLTLIFADAHSGFEQLLSVATPGPQLGQLAYGWSSFTAAAPTVDAWFLDGFAPAKNPQMWTAQLFSTIAKLSSAGTTFATFTAAGIVRRGLLDVGFDVRKTPGFGRKREMICGEFAGASPAQKPSQPDRASATTRPSASWHVALRQATPVTDVAVIGAGLAGCHSAYALARRGIKVTLLEQSEIAAGASGNPQGIVYSKLSPKPGALADFNISALSFALRFYHHHGFFGSCGDSCGVLQLPENAKQAQQQRALAELFARSAELVQWQDCRTASVTAGISLPTGGLWLPQAGWLHPPQLCRALAQQPEVRLLTHSRVHTLVRSADQWQLLDHTGATLCRASAVIVACADSAKRIDQCALLPLKAIRGQISLASATSTSQSLRTVLCGKGYIAPQREHRHCLGASYNLQSCSTDNSWDEHQSNLAGVSELAPDLARLTVSAIDHGRVSFRCTSPDYLPLVGPVADAQAMLSRFADYRSNSKTTIDAPGAYWPGLFINTGHGSKGLTYTPLCAELLASIITNQPLPLPRALALHLHPSRFIIRDLSRKRI